MKLPKVSFFFFFILGIFGSMTKGLAQINLDTLDNYYHAIISPKTTQDLPSGIKFYTNRMQINRNTHDTLNLIQDLRMLAIGEFKIGNNYDSEEYIVEALDLIDNSSLKSTMNDAKVGLFNQLGRIYRVSNNTTQALDAYDNALKIASNTTDSIVVLNNKANIYKDLEAYDQAINIYHILYEKAKIIKDSLRIALALDNLGDVQTKSNIPDGIDNLQSALKIRKDKNNLVGLYASYKHLSEYYLLIGDKEKAKEYAEDALNTSNKINSSSFKLDALSLLMTLNDDPRVMEYSRLNDSVAKAKQIVENKNTFAKYNVTEERKKTEANRLLQEIEKRKRLIYQSLSLIAIVLLISSIFIYRYRYKKVKIEEAYKTEIRISKKIHDEVANDMYRLMTELERTNTVQPSNIDSLEKIYQKTRNISNATSIINVGEDFGSALNDMLLAYRNDQVSIVTLNLTKISWSKISDLKKTTIYRVLQELMTNMRKHSKASSVALRFEKRKGKLFIKYSDNGVGCDLKKTGGLQNVEIRINSLKGTIKFESNTMKGFTATILV